MGIDDYKSNSHKSKENNLPPDPAKVKKIADGKVVRRNGLQKLADAVIAEDTANVKDYILYDVIIPAVKAAVVDVVQDGIELLVEGQIHGRSNRKGGSYISYDSKSSRRAPNVSYNSSRSEYDRRSRYGDYDGYRFDNIIVPTRGEAEDILFTMEEIISEYGIVRVADLYDLVGITGSYTDNRYGWKDIRGATFMRTRDGYVLKFPKAIAIT